MSGPRENQDRAASCRGCGGTAARRKEGGFPVGWYGLTVAVPHWYADGAEAEPYVWVGVFCGAACLIAYGPQIARMEELARQVYETTAPVPAALAGTGNPAGRKGPRS